MNNFSGYSCNARGRESYPPRAKHKTSDRRWYQHDIDTIIYSEMFRKMQRKSQLFSMRDPIARSRLIHTFEVMRIAKEISEKLSLNTELTEGIALAHDFGNVTFGKEADTFLKEHTDFLFKHEEVSGLMLQVASSRLIPDVYRKRAKEKIKDDSSIVHTIEIEKDVYPYKLDVFEYQGDIYYISISPELLDGVVKHGTTNDIYTLEGQVVNYADNIAYLIQDIKDFEETGILRNNDKERYARSLNDLAEYDDNKDFPLQDIVGKTTSIRTAALIERFVSFNTSQLEKGAFSEIDSPILGMKIPKLVSEDIVREAIDHCWDFKKDFYQHELIKHSNSDSHGKISQIWEMLDKGSLFLEKNQQAKRFFDFLDCPIFASYKIKKGIADNDTWFNWKKACFIAHLTCDDIELIIHSCLSRDYVFDFSLPVGFEE